MSWMAPCEADPHVPGFGAADDVRANLSNLIWVVRSPLLARTAAEIVQRLQMLQWGLCTRPFSEGMDGLELSMQVMVTWNWEMVMETPT